MTASVYHTETWTMTIEPDEGEQWPHVEINYGPAGKLISVRTIRAVMHRGDDQPFISIIGPKLKKDGTPGAVDARLTFYRTGIPEWALEVVERERKLHNLGPGATGVGW